MSPFDDRPDLEYPGYLNTGHKSEASAFAKELATTYNVTGNNAACTIATSGRSAATAVSSSPVNGQAIRRIVPVRSGRSVPT